MRSYPKNSPEAAARIVALLLIADGHVCRSELDSLADVDAERRLGLPPGGLAPVLQTLCEDLMTASMGAAPGAQAVDSATLDALLDEIDDRRLQALVLELAESAITADAHLADEEMTVLHAAERRWHAAAAARREADADAARGWRRDVTAAAA